MRVRNKVLWDLMRHAASEPDEEVCGFVYEDRYVELKNCSKSKLRFEADPVDIARALARYGEPIAIFHTHPNGSTVPSSRDLCNWHYPSCEMWIGSTLPFSPDL